MFVSSETGGVAAAASSARCLKSPIPGGSWRSRSTARGVAGLIGAIIMAAPAPAPAESIQHHACAQGAWALGKSGAPENPALAQLSGHAFSGNPHVSGGGLMVNPDLSMRWSSSLSSSLLSERGGGASLNPSGMIPESMPRWRNSPEIELLRRFEASRPAWANPDAGDKPILGRLLAQALNRRRDETSYRIPSDEAIANAGPIKLSPREQAYLPKAKACNDATRALNDSEQALLSAAEVPLGSATTLAEWANTPGHGPAPAAFAPALRNLSAYDASCLESTARPEQLKELVGVLTIDGKPACTAFRRSANRIWTARHCIYDAADNRRYAMVRPGSVWFSYPGEPDARYEVCSETRNSKAAGSSGGFPMQDDYIELLVAGSPPAPPQIPVDTAGLAKGADLTLFGLFSDLQLISTGPSSELSWMRESKSGCVVGEVTADGCIVHSCQAVQGTSGAPVFVVRDDKLVLVAMHVGGGTKACTVKGLKSAAYNVAIPAKRLAE
ncbi:hypothetical protein [Burkholderia sp. Cy-637]|uniref:trypsin-like serine peptidase n=2 Tax=unclassified Burkholderia TaxID=2613784 RepID=UPI00141F2D31|nr:hypothetical protein [Burkholderia sp. Cy-637]NIF90013.1 hypothetical protein [Burkholderia sp. Cy-637]